MPPANMIPGSSARSKSIVKTEEKIRENGLPKDAVNLQKLKAMGFSDRRLAKLIGVERRQGARPSPQARRAPGVQAHRYLRRRIRLAHRLHVFDL